MVYKERECETCRYRYAELTFKLCGTCGYSGTNHIPYDWDEVSYDNIIEPCETEGEGDNIRYL